MFTSHPKSLPDTRPSYLQPLVTSCFGPHVQHGAHDLPPWCLTRNAARFLQDFCHVRCLVKTSLTETTSKNKSAPPRSEPVVELRASSVLFPLVVPRHFATVRAMLSRLVAAGLDWKARCVSVFLAAADKNAEQRGQVCEGQSERNRLFCTSPMVSCDIYSSRVSDAISNCEALWSTRRHRDSAGATSLMPSSFCTCSKLSTVVRSQMFGRHAEFTRRRTVYPVDVMLKQIPHWRKPNRCWRSSIAPTRIAMCSSALDMVAKCETRVGSKLEADQ